VWLKTLNATRICGGIAWNRSSSLPMFIPKYSAQAQPPGWLAEVQLRKGNCARTKRAAREADQLIGDETEWKKCCCIQPPIKSTKPYFGEALFARIAADFK
jgi:hypothetical protein